MTDLAKAGRARVVRGITYASAGVDIEADDRAIDLFKPLAEGRRARSARRAGIRRAIHSPRRLPRTGAWRPPATTNVGTNSLIAQAMDKHTGGPGPGGRWWSTTWWFAAPSRCSPDETYIAVGPDRARATQRDRRRYRRWVHACRLCAAWRQTAERADRGPITTISLPPASASSRRTARFDRVKPGDVIIAMGSSGLHSNGYSLVARCCWRSTG